MKYIGIDLAWTEKNETGLCVLGDGGAAERLEAARFSLGELADLIRSFGREELTIAVDAPLLVRNETGSRTAERELVRDRIHGNRLNAFMASRSFLNRRFGGLRGEDLVREIQSVRPDLPLNRRTDRGGLYETFPTGICCGLFPDLYPLRYKRKRGMSPEDSLAEMKRLKARLKEWEEAGILSGVTDRLGLPEGTPGGKELKHLEDRIDGFLCALGAFIPRRLAVEERSYGTPAEGAIILPVLRDRADLR